MRDLTTVEQDNEDLKNKILDTDRELFDVQFKYERDKALWNEKFEFL